MFRFKTPLMALLLTLGWGVDLNIPVVAQERPAASVQSQRAPKNQTLSLDEAIAIAIENNEELQIARLQVEQAEAALQVARSAKSPVVSASGRLFRTDNATFDANPGGVVQTAQQAQIAQQTAINAAQQRQATRGEFLEQLQRLQVQLQDTGLTQEDTVDQQINELANRAGASTVLPQTGGAQPFNRFQGFTPSTSVQFFDSIENALEGDVTLSYNILTGGSRSAGIRAAKKQLESSQLEVQRLTRELKLGVATFYYDLQEVRALTRVALSALSSAQETLNNTILTEQAGLSTKFEILQAEVQLANANQNLSLAQSLQLTAQRQLAETLSFDEPVNLVPTDSVDPVGEWSTELPDSIVIAQNQRLELQQILLSRDVQQAQKTIVRAAKRPNLSSFAQLSAGVSDVEPRNPADPNVDNFQGRVGYGVGLTLNFNAFDGGAIKAQVQELKDNIKILETQYDDQKNTIRVEVERSFFSLRQNRQNIDTSKVAVDLAEESLELARLRLRAGIGTQLDVIQAESDLTRAEGNLISAVLDYNRAVASIARATAFQLPIEGYAGTALTE